MPVGSASAKLYHFVSLAMLSQIKTQHCDSWIVSAISASIHLPHKLSLHMYACKCLLGLLSNIAPDEIIASDDT